MRLLVDIRSIFEARETDRLRSADLVAALGEMEDRPWPEWKNGRAMSAPQLARQLGHFQISPRTMRLPDGNRKKGYERTDFEQAWERYAPPRPSLSQESPLPNRDSVTTRANIERNPISQSVTSEACHVSENDISPNKDGHCNAVTVSNPPSGGREGKEPPQSDLWAGEADL